MFTFLKLFTLILSLEMGVVNGDVCYGITEYDYDRFDMDHPYYVEFTVDFTFCDILFVRGSMNNLFHRSANTDGGLRFSPDHDEYIFCAGISLGDFMEIAYRHKCYHPIQPYLREKIYTVNLIEGEYDEVYFKINARIN